MFSLTTLKSVGAVAIVLASASAAQALPLLAFPSTIAFSGGGDAQNNGSVLRFTGSNWTGLDFFAAIGNATVTQPPTGVPPTGSLAAATGNATFSDTFSLTSPGPLFTTSDGFSFSWNTVTTNYLGNGVYNAYFRGVISKSGSFDPTPFALSFSTQPSASSETAGMSWSAQGAVISLPGTVALLGSGLLLGAGVLRRKYSK